MSSEWDDIDPSNFLTTLTEQMVCLAENYYKIWEKAVEGDTDTT